LITVDVSASTEAFVGTVCLIAVRRSVSGRTECHRCGRVGKTPRHTIIIIGLSTTLCKKVHGMATAVKISEQRILKERWNIYSSWIRI